ncbi:helix-turn-helix transcriptional regulator [Rhizobium leguminosarum]|uniref:helix-turn-helix transcriptional regulator n=1 Tax=Rhizobium leguminosarum TaxID=384 RepID=UPI0036DDEF30
MTIPPRLIGRKEAAEYCSISPTCFSMWVASHKMPPPIPGTRKWDKKAIDAKLDEISGLVPVNESRPAGNAWAEWKARSRERDKYRPLHRLDAREERVLRFMIAHTDHLTVDLIPQAGEKTMEALAKVGVVRSGGKDYRGMRDWSVTDEGRAEVERIDTWTNWKF